MEKILNACQTGKEESWPQSCRKAAAGVCEAIFFTLATTTSSPGTMQKRNHIQRTDKFARKYGQTKTFFAQRKMANT
jgi:hypothetical protein